MRVPRAYVVSRAIYDMDPKSTLERISSEASTRCEKCVWMLRLTGTPKVSFQGDATIKLYRNNRVQIDAQLSEPGILVLTDAFLSWMESFR